MSQTSLVVVEPFLICSNLIKALTYIPLTSRRTPCILHPLIFIPAVKLESRKNQADMSGHPMIAQ